MGLLKGELVLLVLLFSAIAALPGLIALILWRRKSARGARTPGRRVDEQARLDTRFEVQAKLAKQLQETVDAHQETIRFLSGEVNDLRKSHAREFAETETIRQELIDLRQEVRELHYGVRVLTDQLRTAELTPAWSPPAKSGKRPMEKKQAGPDEAIDPVKLWQQIVKGFNLQEIDDLAFNLGVSSDDISGGTKRARARSLIDYMQNHNRIHELDELVRSERPGGEGQDG